MNEPQPQPDASDSDYDRLSDAGRAWVDEYRAAYPVEPAKCEHGHPTSHDLYGRTANGALEFSGRCHGPVSGAALDGES